MMFFSNPGNLLVHPICYSDSNLIQRNLLNKRMMRFIHLLMILIWSIEKNNGTLIMKRVFFGHFLMVFNLTRSELLAVFSGVFVVISNFNLIVLKSFMFYFFFNFFEFCCPMLSYRLQSYHDHAIAT